ncbi:MAG: IS5 family transposase, partial [Pseudomonadota bacterium]
GRSRGGLTTKVHVAADALGLPVRILVAPGHRGDVLQGRGLIDGLAAGHVIADMAYDADHFRDSIAAAGATATIPSHPDRSRRVPCDWRMYRERNLVERLMGRLKQFRRIATRYDKLAANFRGFVLIAAVCLWLK